MNPRTWESLSRYFQDCLSDAAEPASEMEIQTVESQLNKTFPKDYRDFLLKYGGALCGAIIILGLKKPQFGYNQWNLLVENQFFKTKNWPGVSNWLIVGIDNGNPIGIDQSEKSTCVEC